MMRNDADIVDFDKRNKISVDKTASKKKYIYIYTYLKYII